LIQYTLSEMGKHKNKYMKRIQ